MKVVESFLFEQWITLLRVTDPTLDIVFGVECRIL